jgi:hypothetical protein
MWKVPIMTLVQMHKDYYLQIFSLIEVAVPKSEKCLFKRSVGPFPLQRSCQSHVKDILQSYMSLGR